MTKTKKGYELYPLTVAQKFHLYYLPYCPSAAVLNIGTSLTIGTEVDWEVLRGSINKAYERSEAMRIRFTKDADGTYYQYIVDDTEDRKSRLILSIFMDSRWKRRKIPCGSGHLSHFRLKIRQ